MAQAPDGTVFYQRPGFTGGNQNEIVALDGGTGQVKFRVRPSEMGHFHQEMICGLGEIDSDLPAAIASAPVVDASGVANVLVIRLVISGGCNVTHTEADFFLYRMTAAGAVSTISLGHDGGSWSSPFGVLRPDEHGGLIVHWAASFWDASIGTYHTVSTAYYVNESGTLASTFTSPSSFVRLVGSGGIGYAGNGGPASIVTAFDITNGAVLWQAPGTPVAALDGGRVAVNFDNAINGGTGGVLGPDGSLVATGQARMSPLLMTGDTWIGRELSTNTFGAFVATPAKLDAFAAYPMLAGSPQGTGAPPKVWVDNKQGTANVLVKLELCFDGFQIVPPGKQLRGGSGIDGVKPPAWSAPPGTVFGQDWYKVPNAFSVTIDASGNATKSASAYAWLKAFASFALPECDPSTECAASGSYHIAGGRKFEPEWSAGFVNNADPYSAIDPTSPWHWDWRYVAPVQPDRRARCGTQNGE